MGLVVKTEGEATVHVPREVVAKGGKAIDAYVAKARGPKRTKTAEKKDSPESNPEEVSE